MVCFRLVRNARLIDVRKAISVLPALLDAVEHNETNKRLVDILKLTLGMSSIHEQLALLKLAGVPETACSVDRSWSTCARFRPVTWKSVTFSSTVSLDGPRRAYKIRPNRATRRVTYALLGLYQKLFMNSSSSTSLIRNPNVVFRMMFDPPEGTIR